MRVCAVERTGRGRVEVLGCSGHEPGRALGDLTVTEQQEMVFKGSLLISYPSNKRPCVALSLGEHRSAVQKPGLTTSLLPLRDGELAWDFVSIGAEFGSWLRTQ